jgi:hypothetical protein
MSMEYKQENQKQERGEKVSVEAGKGPAPSAYKSSMVSIISLILCVRAAGGLRGGRRCEGNSRKSCSYHDNAVSSHVHDTQKRTRRRMKK